MRKRGQRDKGRKVITGKGKNVRKDWAVRQVVRKRGFREFFLEGEGPGGSGSGWGKGGTRLQKLLCYSQELGQEMHKGHNKNVYST